MRNTSSKKPVRVGVFSRIAQADRAVHALVAAGFPKDQITVICPSCTAEKFDEYKKEQPAGAHTPAAAAGGSAIGAVLGGLVAAVGVVASGGIGLLVAGPLLAGAAGGAVAGGLIGAMSTRGLEKEVANFYDQALQKGKILVAIEYEGEGQDERLATAERVLSEAGAEPLALPEG